MIDLNLPPAVKGAKQDMEIFTLIEKHEFQLALCPLCGSVAELWERNNPDIQQAHKAVMCTHRDEIGPLESGCPLYMPPESFYCARKKEAVYFWNAFSVAVSSMRRKQHWKNAKVLREKKP